MLIFCLWNIISTLNIAAAVDGSLDNSSFFELYFVEVDIIFESDPLGPMWRSCTVGWGLCEYSDNQLYKNMNLSISKIFIFKAKSY